MKATSVVLLKVGDEFPPGFLEAIGGYAVEMDV